MTQGAHFRTGTGTVVVKPADDDHVFRELSHHRFPDHSGFSERRDSSSHVMVSSEW